ncbi:hypothetical protein DPMN_061097 [Dreissena polymorpha]|uniref:Uncharacterized protein n=1 Tax=Dreissena polymorpha TaxID=45954 RepID=A0A9D4HI33_DREPO|nr:hypothetical protein DPMN_061097 [Dreissena polymorpha]
MSFYPFSFFKSLRSGIRAICVLSNAQILVSDSKKIINLNHRYQVVGHCDLTTRLHDMCQITSNEVAVVVNAYDKHEVQFVSVNDGRLVMGTKLEFQHPCFGIARNKKDLYLTSGTALYKYSISGTRLNKLYKDTTARTTGYMTVDIYWFHAKFLQAILKYFNSFFQIS